MSIWIRKYIKRFLRQKIFVILLLAVPIGTFLLSYVAYQDETGVRVGLVCEGGSLGSRIEQGLQKHPGMMQFFRLESKEKLQQAIRQGDLECGYYFPMDMEEKYSQHHYPGVVTRYYRKGSMFYTIADEVVLAEIFRQQGENILNEYIWQSGLFQTERITREEVSEEYVRNLEEQRTFAFSYHDKPGAEKQLGDYLVAPIRGCIALLVLLAGFCGVSLYLQDRSRELEAALPGRRRRRLLPIVSVAVPVFLISGAGLIAEGLCGFGFLSIKEIAYMIIYDIIVVLFCNLLCKVKIQEGTLWVAALGYLCASAVLTPVFINLSVLIPGIHILSYLCLPYYFLTAVFGGWMGFVKMLLLLGGLTVVNGIFNRRASGSMRRNGG